MFRTCELVVVLSACTPSAIAPPPSSPTPAPVVAGPPTLFAELVRPDATWTFKGETRHVEGDDRHTDTGEVTCTANGHAIRRGWATEIACSGLSYANLVDGTYVITSAGMWLVSDLTDDTPLPADQMLLAATPAPIERKTEHDEHGDSFGEAWKAQKLHDAWCVSHDDWGGDEGGWALCIQAGKGIVGGSGYFAGGFTHDTFFGEVPGY